MKSARSAEGRTRYWRTNLRLVASLLVVWFLVSFGLGILLVEPLNAWRLAGFPLGFWFAQQGSIYVFIVLIFVYAVAMDRLDRHHGSELRRDDDDPESGGRA